MCGVSVWFVGCFLVNKKNNNNLTDSNARFQVSHRHLVKKKKKKENTALYLSFADVKAMKPSDNAGCSANC